jgi:hypothetical protein
MDESMVEYAVQRSDDYLASLARLPKPSQAAIKRIVLRLGKWVTENPKRVTQRGAGYVYRHDDPRVDITYCVDKKKGTLRATWVALSLKPRLLIFISYSHKDKEWLETLKNFLTLLENDGNVRAWEDGQIKPGEQWRVAIDEALASASVAVLLVTQNFIASEFIQKVELPELLEHHANGRLELNWILVRPCTYKDTPLADIEALWPPPPTLIGMSEAEREEVLVAIYDKLKAACEKLMGAPLKTTKFPKVR